MPTLNRTWSFELDGILVAVTVKSVKYLRLRVVPPQGEVRVSAPLGVSQAEVRQFVQERREWLLHARREVVARAEIRRPVTSSGVAWLWGVKYRATLTIGRWESAHRIGDAIHIVASEPGRADLVLDTLYRRELDIALEPMLDRWQERVGRNVKTLRFRRMTSRWGSCNSRTASITLNLALAQFRPEFLEYVLVHELVHLWEHGHGAGFQARMTALLPHWRQRRRELKEMQP